jgi:quercetin dioxygenase-like cupin family protein
MKMGLAVAAVVAVACVASAQGKETTQAPREKLKQVRAEPERAGKQLTRSVTLRPGSEKWTAGPPSLPAGIQMIKVEGDPATADRLFTLRLKLPAGTRLAPHFHGTDEHLTIVSGEFEL